MRARIVKPAAEFLVLAVVAAGCTSERNGNPVVEPGTTTNGSPGTTNPSTSVSPTEDQTSGAPRVSDPLDASKFLTQPCAVLTQAQLTVFSVSRPGKPDTEGAVAKNAGPGCVWHTGAPLDSTISIGFMTGNKKGLSDTYRGRSRFEYFEETTVDGYPSVFNDIVEGRPSGQCNLVVGISDTLTFLAREEGRLVGQAVCDRAKQVAAAVIATLKASA